ncbi:hypothetical protein [Streptomyces sp. NPDC093097]
MPRKILLTPPDKRSYVTLDRPYGGSILNQPGATHPGTFVCPIGVG